MKIHNSTYDLDQYSQHHVAYSPAMFEVATSNRYGGDAFTRKCFNSTFDLDLGVKFTQNVAQYPLHHVAYSPARFEVVTSNL